MKLWHDDIRRPPDATWTWARTNTEALELMRAHLVTDASLDHDLGLHHVDPDEYVALSADDAHALFCAHTGSETGVDLVRQMIAEGLLPDRVRIHSFNPTGAAVMASLLAETGRVTVEVRPFEGSR